MALNVLYYFVDWTMTPKVSSKSLGFFLRNHIMGSRRPLNEIPEVGCLSSSGVIKSVLQDRLKRVWQHLFRLLLKAMIQGERIKSWLASKDQYSKTFAQCWEVFLDSNLSWSFSSPVAIHSYSKNHIERGLPGYWSHCFFLQFKFFIIQLTIYTPSCHLV